jgi:hypothetical protein
MLRPKVWIAGDSVDPSLAHAAAWLHTAADCRVVSLAHLDEGSTGLADEPAAIVFLQARPGSVAQEAVERFHHRAPQARLLAIVGPWCAGELRSGRPCKGVKRMHWHQWPSCLPAELGLTGGSGRPQYRSRMITEFDILLRTLTPALHRPLRPGRIAVAADCRESFSTLADACWAIGWRSVWQPPGSPPQLDGADLLLVDGWDSLPRELPAHRRDARHLPPAVLLLDWPQQADLDRAHELGIARVLARPLLLADLLASLDALLASASQVWPARSAA